MAKRRAEANWMGKASDIAGMLRHHADCIASGEEVRPERVLLIAYDHNGNPQIRTMGYGDQGSREIVGALNEGVLALSAAIASTNTRTGN